VAAARAEALTAARPGARGTESLAQDVRAAGKQVPRIAEEQAALRRVAMLVARGEPPEAVFAAVAAEVGQVVPTADFALVGRYDPDGAVEIVGAWSRTGNQQLVGLRTPLGGRNVNTLVFERNHPARVDHLTDDASEGTAAARKAGARSSAGAPISVEGRLWGVMIVASAREDALPGGTEHRLAGFTELAATAIANAQARTELRGFADEQAALRRVATLVARGTPPQEVFAAVTTEVGRVLYADITVLNQYDPDGTQTAVGVWSGTGVLPVPVGTRTDLGGRNVSTLVFQTSRPARIDNYVDVSGPVGQVAREVGIRAAVGVPISVEGRLWGVMIVASGRDVLLPADTEARLAGFTELVATAIANAQARVELRGFADEQAALRRVASLVARAAPPEEVFTAVAAEAGRLLKADYTVLSRYDADGLVTVVGGWARTDPGRPLAIGLRLKPEGRNIHALVFQTGRPARIDDYGTASGAFADVARDWQYRSSVGVPITVAGRLWGVMIGGSREEPLPAGTEARLAGLTELVGTALANAEAQAALTASRARIVAAADQARRRIERDLHDGAQQRLVSLVLQLRAAQAAPPGAGELAQRLEGAVTEVTGALEELREIARGIHPAILTQSGLRPALRALARRSAVPVSLDVQVAGRLPEPVEIAAYYAVSESLTNTAKHAHASAAEVEVVIGDGALRVRVRDDGCGGADLSRGSGLAGLKDRVEALGGRIWLHSPPGAGTAVQIVLPLGGTGSWDYAAGN
jgi:signal transduction histidine kinase